MILDSQPPMDSSPRSDRHRAPRVLPDWLARLFWVLWVIWGVAWTVGLLRPEPIQVRQVIIPDSWAYAVSKSLHVFGYAALVLWPAWRFGPRWAGPVALGHGALTETLQPYCGRNGSLMDVGFDAGGVLLGLAIAFWLNGVIGRKGCSGERA